MSQSSETQEAGEIIGGMITVAHEQLVKAEAAAEMAHKTAKLLNHESAGDLYWATEHLMDAKHRLDAAYRKGCV